MCEQGSRVLKARSQSNFFILFSENLKLSRQRCTFQKTQLPAEPPMMKFSTVVILETWPSSSLMLLQLRKKPASPLLESVFYDWLTNKTWQNRHHSNFSATALTARQLPLSSLGARALEASHHAGRNRACPRRKPRQASNPAAPMHHPCDYAMLEANSWVHQHPSLRWRCWNIFSGRLAYVVA